MLPLAHRSHGNFYHYKEHRYVLPPDNDSEELEPEWLALQETERDDNIFSFPLIRVYHRDGRMDLYNGDGQAREISLFLRMVLRPAFLDSARWPTDDAAMEADRQEMRPLAKEYAELVRSVVTAANEYSEILASVRVKSGQKTGLVREDAKTGDIQAITASAVQCFLDEILSGQADKLTLTYTNRGDDYDPG
ncbi:hypothetical protein VTK56DRAFT_10202 [Thermocarpiscus australiensis]